MGATVQPAFRAGDALFVAGEVLQGARPWRGVGSPGRVYH
jgi:hypothetical protein